MEKRTNEQWLAELGSPDNSQALDDLRLILVRGLNIALVGRVDERQREALVEDSAQEALLKILDNLEQFEGRSQFTTWAHKIAVRVALTELRRQRWKDISLEDLLPEESSVDYTPPILNDPGPTPEEQAARDDMMAMVQRILNEELTKRQRTAMQAVLIGGMPLEEVARRMDTNRNAMYKLLHDARLRIKKRLAVEGLTPQDILAAFSEE